MTEVIAKTVVTNYGVTITVRRDDGTTYDVAVNPKDHEVFLHFSVGTKVVYPVKVAANQVEIAITDREPPRATQLMAFDDVSMNFLTASWAKLDHRPAHPEDYLEYVRSLAVEMGLDKLAMRWTHVCGIPAIRENFGCYSVVAFLKYGDYRHPMTGKVLYSVKW